MIAVPGQNAHVEMHQYISDHFMLPIGLIFEIVEVLTERSEEECE